FNGDSLWTHGPLGDALWWRAQRSSPRRRGSCSRLHTSPGTINPVAELCEKAHAVGALTLLDAAQSVGQTKNFATRHPERSRRIPLRDVQDVAAVSLDCAQDDGRIDRCFTWSSNISKKVWRQKSIAGFAK